MREPVRVREGARQRNRITVTARSRLKAVTFNCPANRSIKKPMKMLPTHPWVWIRVRVWVTVKVSTGLRVRVRGSES